MREARPGEVVSVYIDTLLACASAVATEEHQVALNTPASIGRRYVHKATLTTVGGSVISRECAARMAYRSSLDIPVVVRMYM